MEEEKEVSPVWFAIAVTMAVFFLFNVLMAAIWVLLPDDLCFPPFSAHQAALRAARYRERLPQAHAYYTAQSYYSLRSVYVDGSRSRQVTVFNGYVETDEDFDAWAYWATDSEETLAGSAFGHRLHQSQSQAQSLRSGQTQGQFQYYRQHDLHSTAGSSARETGYQLPSSSSTSAASTVTGARGHAARLALGMRSEYNPEPRMESSPNEAPPPRYSQIPREVNCSLHPRAYPYPQTPPPVRTWGHGGSSTATIRPVVENHRRETGASQTEGYVKPKAESIREGDSD